MKKTLTADLKEFLSSRSASYAFLSRAFQQEPTDEMLKTLVDTVQSRSVSDANADDDVLQTYLRSLKGQDLKMIANELATEFAGLFLNTGKHPIYPFESVYTSTEHLMMQRAYDEVLQEYRQAGVNRAPDFKEPEDHIALELEFMAILGRKTLESLESGDWAEGLGYLEKQNDFVNKHLSKWVPQFCQDVERVAQSGFYKGIALIAVELVNSEKETLPELMAEVKSA